MDKDKLLARLAALGITKPDASDRQHAIALADKLVELGDETNRVTLVRKAQSWLQGEKGAPAMLGVVLTLLEKQQEAMRSLRQAA